MMKRSKIFISFCLLFVSAGLSFSQSGEQDHYTDVFLSHLRNNWDDIHDVIMRFHYQNPELNGLVAINMEWINGKLDSASVDSNTTGDNDFGPALIFALKKWEISGLPERWEMSIPFRTMIVGSDDPHFREKGIFTGKVTDPQGKPIGGAMVILRPLGIDEAIADTAFTNREGIFVRTLIEPGSWEIYCIKPGYTMRQPLKTIFEPGMHIIKEIVIN